MLDLNMTFSKVDFVLAFAISFSDRTLSRFVFGEQDLLKTNANFVLLVESPPYHTPNQTEIATEELCPRSLL